MENNVTTFDVTILGGGIVGVSTAWQMQKDYPDAAILLIEKESALARHQTGHNSGVIHAGVYYQPGSLKADFCKRGAATTYAFCREHDLPYLQCGKLLVATDDLEYERMDDLETRCGQNCIEVHRWSQAELTSAEPWITGKGALYVPATGITDYPAIATKMAQLFVDAGGHLNLGQAVSALHEGPQHIRIDVGRQQFQTKYLIACGGLMADRIAQMIGIHIDLRIVPFRGEYYQLPKARNAIIRHLIYPIPDPELPFLGVHLTRMVDGSVTIGPNAVLGWKREGYQCVNFDLRDTFDMLSFSGFWKVIKANFSSGLGEVKDSLYKRGYLRRVQKYCPSLTAEELQPYPAGIRAQAVLKDGTLVHDFHFAESQRSLHVLNAPSPAATSAIPIGAYLLEKGKAKFNL